MEAERRLVVLYVAAFVASLVSATSLAIAWRYWDPTLNSCIHVNCGCLLYSVLTFSSFVGGGGWFCRFAVFVHTPVLVWATVGALFHAYRVYVPRRAPTVRRRTVTFYEDGSRRNLSANRDPPHYLPLAVLSLLATVAIFAQSWIVTAGYYSTCKEYRRAVSNQLQANGNMAQLVFDRLSCQTIFDFLDYIQPDPELLPDKYRRTYNIHTAYYLQTAILSSWVDCTIWLAIAVFNIYLAFCVPAK